MLNSQPGKASCVPDAAPAAGSRKRPRTTNEADGGRAGRVYDEKTGPLIDFYRARGLCAVSMPKGLER